MENEIKVGDCFRGIDDNQVLVRVLPNDEEMKIDHHKYFKTARLSAFDLQVETFVSEMFLTIGCEPIPFEEFKHAVDRVVEQALEVK